MILDDPPLHKGWLKKYSRSGLLKNWKARYFVLDAGNCIYYENKKTPHIPPYGENEKGGMILRGATVTVESARVIRLVGKLGAEKDILLEVENAGDVKVWVEAFESHIKCANLQFSRHDNHSVTEPTGREAFSSLVDASQHSDIFSDAVIPNPAFVIKARRLNSNEKVFINVCDHESVPATASGGIMGGQTWPNMVSTIARLEMHVSSNIKTGTTSKEQVWVYDVIVHPSVTAVANDDNVETRNMICKETIKHITKKYKDDLAKEFQIPLVQKKYIGAQIQSLAVKKPSQSIASKRASLRHSADSAAPSPSASTHGSGNASFNPPSPRAPMQRFESAPATVSPSSTSTLNSNGLNDSTSTQTANSEPQNITMSSNSMPRPEYPAAAPNGLLRSESANSAASSRKAPPVSAAGRGFMRQDLAPESPSFSSASSAPYNVNSDSSSSALSSSRTIFPPVNFSPIAVLTPLPTNLPRRLIPYKVTRQAGVVLRNAMDKRAQGKILQCGSQVAIYSRQEQEGFFWLRARDGWVQENLVQRVNEKSLVINRAVGKPARGVIISSNFIDSRGPNSSFGDDAVATAVFKIDLYYGIDQVIRITRTFDQINSLQKALLNCGDSRTKKIVAALNFYSDTVLDMDLMADVTTLLQLIESTDEWIQKVTLDVRPQSCKAYKEFLEPSESDVRDMEFDLMAEHGLGGAWIE